MSLPTSKPVAARYSSNISRLRALGEKRPRLRFGLLSPRPSSGSLRLVLPFRRHWPAIGIAGVFLAVFALPLFLVALQAGPPDNDLFALVFTLFRIFWGLGWSVGVGMLALVFLALLLGREVVVVGPDSLLVRLEVLGLGVGGEYAAQGIANLRPAQPDAAAGTGWRGQHLAFDYYGIPVGFGSALGEPRAAELLNQIQGRLRRPGSFADAISPTPTPPFATAAAPMPAAEVERPGITAAPGWRASLASPSVQVLVLANLVPLAGVWLLGWEIGEIMLLYWAESGIIGFFNLLKMAVVGGWATLFLGPFFVGHYGAFMAAHLLFVYTFFVQGGANHGDLALTEVAARFFVLWPALMALAVSHGISFVGNCLGRREYTGITVQKQMAEPYTRIIIMHLTIIFGGFVVMGLGSSLPALLLLIAAKIATDLRAHARQRR